MTGISTSSIAVNQDLGQRFFTGQDRLRGPAPELCAPEYRAFLGGTLPVHRAGH